MFFVTPHVETMDGRKPATGETIQIPAKNAVAIRTLYVDKVTGATMATSEERHALLPSATSSGPWGP